MHVTEERFLIRRGQFATSSNLSQILTEVRWGIETVRWPKGAEKFTIKPTLKGNGVVPIKEACILHLKSCGWAPEHRLKLAARERPGPLDAVKQLPDGRFFAFEWETGNISSTHRALNKMAVGLLEGVLAGGILVLPTRKLYKFLTDRIGNFEEIVPYFPMWESLAVKDGVLAVFAIEHDAESPRVSLIKKGTDGRALV
jgi:hypothetical protein